MIAWLHKCSIDTQLYTEWRSLDSTQTEALSKYISALISGFGSGLQLNSSKTEAMIFGTRPGLSKLGPIPSLVIGGDVAVKESIKILGVHLDPTLSMDNQVKASIKACNYHICALRHVRRGLTLESAMLIALGLVPSRLLQLAAIWHLQVKSEQTTARAKGSCASRAQAAWNSSSGPLLKRFTGSRFSK